MMLWLFVQLIASASGSPVTGSPVTGPPVTGQPVTGSLVATSLVATSLVAGPPRPLPAHAAILPDLTEWAAQIDGLAQTGLAAEALNQGKEPVHGEAGGEVQWNLKRGERYRFGTSETCGITQGTGVRDTRRFCAFLITHRWALDISIIIADLVYFSAF